MKILRVKLVAQGAVVLVHVEGIKEAVEVLHVGDVTANPNYCSLVEFSEAFDVRETGKGAI